MTSENVVCVIRTAFHRMREPSPQNSCLPRAPLNNLQEEYVETVSDIILPCSKLFLRWLLESSTVPALLCLTKDWNACAPVSLATWSSSNGRSWEEIGLEWGKKPVRVSPAPLLCPALHLQQWPPCLWRQALLPALVGPLLPAVLPAPETKSTFCCCYCLGYLTVSSFPFCSGTISYFLIAAPLFERSAVNSVVQRRSRWLQWAGGRQFGTLVFRFLNLWSLARL